MIYIEVIKVDKFIKGKKIGKSFVANYIYDYLKKLKVETVIIETEYLDKDYFIDYSFFYSRSFNEKPRFTTRFHFFSNKFTIKLLKNILNGKTQPDKLQKNYLGNVVLKPIKDESNEYLIGRTVLVPIKQSNRKDTFVFLKEKIEVTLFGIQLTIESLPFQTQDIGVGACASASLWVCNTPLNRKFGVPNLKPMSEITEIATTHPGLGRTFPSEGLTTYQTINYFRHCNLDIDLISTSSLKNDVEIIPIAIKAYLDAGIPIVATLLLEDENFQEVGYHAAVICGYHANSNGTEIKELYVHDDQLGPYSTVISKDSFITWKNEWKKKKYGIKLEGLIIPVYPKIRLSFGRIQEKSRIIVDEILKKGVKVSCVISLKFANKYKNELMNKNFYGYKIENGNRNLIDKIDFLSTNIPRFIWVLKMLFEDGTIVDFVYDGTEVYANMAFQILYEPIVLP